MNVMEQSILLVALLAQDVDVAVAFNFDDVPCKFTTNNESTLRNWGKNLHMAFMRL